MTLILAAHCNNGICICSDTRYTEKFSDKRTQYNDGNNKVHKFSGRPIAIYNHGVNRFCNKFWNKLCEDFEGNSKWQELAFDALAASFKDFVHQNVVDELANNVHDDKAFFVVCGRTSTKSKWAITEYEWQKGDNNSPHSECHNNGLLRSGQGTTYLTEYLRKNSAHKTSLFWKLNTVDKAEKILQKIFQECIKLRNDHEFVQSNKLTGKEFSDSSVITKLS